MILVHPFTIWLILLTQFTFGLALFLLWVVVRRMLGIVKTLTEILKELTK